MAVTGTTSTASDIQMDYMKLLVTQLQNQNPLEPMDNKDMTAQLAQFSQLQQMESLNRSFDKVLDSVQRSYASSLIGREISFESFNEVGQAETRTGKVEEVAVGDAGEIVLTVNGANVNLSDVVSIRD
ncbi:MAG TPA: flagellar hook capping FlgD N-terminal domain-containing protein [Sedimentisphaerales bacterium]|nr:flagellar hook capping FlgD N-terminal domain-containing protein [Sedimentisphaerales bacterium]HQG47443.1 flagellar hook capping FlgD N-terminal domain-containing protein [Sedimentisphaerales bacterium]